MSLRRRGVWTGLAALALASAEGAPARAQGRLAWNAAPAVGSWVEFDMEIAQGAKVSRGSYRVSALGRAAREGGNLLWCEVVRTKGKKTRVLKVLLPESEVASSDSPLSVAKEVVFQDSGKAAMRASGTELASVVSLLESIQGDAPLTFESLGKEEVTLPDGRTLATFRKVGRAEIAVPGQEPTRVECQVWIARDVPFGVVKRVVTTVQGTGIAETRKVETLTLRSSGETGATSRIQGEIKPFSALGLLLGS